MVIVTLGAPVWEQIYFLKLQVGDMTVHFGVLGSTGRPQQVGYVPADWAGQGRVDPRVDDEHLSNITYALLLHPIAAVLAIVTFALSVIGLGTRKAAVLATCAAVINSLCVVVAFTVDIVLFSILKARFLDPPGSDNRSTSYGSAIWISLVTAIISVIAVLSTFITVFSRARYPRKWESEQCY